MNRASFISCLLVALPTAAPALELAFPAPSSFVAERSQPDDSYFLPTGPFADGTLDGLTAEGAVHQQTWRIGDGTLTTLQMLAPLREQLASLGYDTLFECETKTCGGFDFRYKLNLMPEPDMHVNLGDFRYLAARKTGGAAPEYLGLLVSRSANTGFVHLTEIGPAESHAEINASTKAPDAPTMLQAAVSIGEQLDRNGHAALDDLKFPTGSSHLGNEIFASLSDLAAYLTTHPDSHVMLVGHTDDRGGLAGNISLSRKRARSVADRLVADLGVSRRQVSADGVGFLAPRASNETEDGRARNRRVEAVLTSTR